MEMRQQGGMEAYLNKIANERDMSKLTDLFCDLIRMSYGVKNLDGGFDRSPEHFKKFEQSEAYSDLYVRLATDADFAASFVNDIMPKNLDKKSEGGDRNKLAVERAKQMAREKIAVLKDAEVVEE
jgi:hypothetical protein